MALISAQEAAQIIHENVTKPMNLGRRLPTTLERIRLLMREESFPICNVGPWPHQIDRACLHITIPGYDPAKHPKGYAESDPMPSVWREAKIVDENEFGWFEDEGRYVARDCIGIGFGLPQRNSLVHWGVFVPDGKEPTPQEIAAARARLKETGNALIQEAREAYDQGPRERAAVINDRHLYFARQFGINEGWVHSLHTQESVRCEMCGTFNPAGVAKCQKCNEVIDFALFAKLKARQEEQMKALGLAPHEPNLRPKL